MTRGGRVIAFIEAFCRVPEGKWVGRPIVLDPFQKDFILAVYDNPHGTLRAILSLARKNGKTALIAGILLAHIAGPEARQNSQIVSGAMSRDQAAIIFKLAVKMINLNEELVQRTRIIPSSKIIMGLSKNVEFRALAAEGKTTHGLSPILAILDEVGQVRGPQSDFIDAIITAQGAHDAPLVITISTQAPNDTDLLSVWIDDALEANDPHTIIHLYTAPPKCALNDRKAWAAANPAISTFRSLRDVEDQAARAERMPSSQPTFRNLTLNQRVEMVSPLVSQDVWEANGRPPDAEAFLAGEVYAGLDLSARNDLTAAVLIADYEDEWHVRSIFWTPRVGLEERSKRDRVDYMLWVEQGFLRVVDGASIDYDEVVRQLAEEVEDMNLLALAFDRWRMDVFDAACLREDVDFPTVEFGQGFRSMAPAIDDLESDLNNGKLRHGNHPVLTMCMNKARVETDPAGNRKLNKAKATGRIDGAVALAMARGAAGPSADDEGDLDDMINDPIMLS
jgi:phage terminase large subunit-like protein